MAIIQTDSNRHHHQTFFLQSKFIPQFIQNEATNRWMPKFQKSMKSEFPLVQMTPKIRILAGFPILALRRRQVQKQY